MEGEKYKIVYIMVICTLFELKLCSMVNKVAD